MTEQLENLYRTQLQTFELAQKNYAALEQAVYRTIQFSGYELRLQYNPARILSTNARIDTATLQHRRCFLCTANMPDAQKGIPYGEHYRIFINPYPIFTRHFTVPSREHTPQQMEGRFPDMLNLAFDLPGYTLFYNGGQCGASAPDHFHFQIAPRGIMPTETDVENPDLKQIIRQEDYYSIFTIENYLRRIIVLKASDHKLLVSLFDGLNRILRRHIPSQPEPMYNLLAWFDNCQWTVCIFPRKLLRPRQFFAEGNEKILFSPGSVDMAGLIISPRREDFEKYSAPLLTDLFSQVTIGEETWQKIATQIKHEIL